jgi:STE24 endopeptidase
LLQHKIYQQAVKVPEELKEIINEETYDKARVYGLDKSSFSIIKEIFDVTTTVVRLILFNKIMQDRRPPLWYSG